MARIIARDNAGGADSRVRDWRTGVPASPRPQSRVARVDQAAEARSRAAAILLHARAQARAVIATAQATAHAVASAERQQAWESGYADGLAQAQRDSTVLVQRLASIVANTAVAHEAGLRNLDREALALVLAITRSIVKREVQCAPATILSVVRTALEELSLQASVLLRVHPTDAQVLQSHLPALDIPPSATVSIVADDAISPGGCLIESGAGCVDATIETQLDRIGHLLREHLHAA